MPSKGSKEPEDSAGITEKQQALERVKWLKSLAQQLLQEASELEVKWGANDSGDATNLDASASAVEDVARLSDILVDGSAKATKKGKKNKNKKKTELDARPNTTAVDTAETKKPSGGEKTSKGQDIEPPVADKAKSKKNKKRKHDDIKDSSASVKDAATDTPQTKKASKKDKNNKNKGLSQDTETVDVSAKNNSNAADKWNVNALGGGSERQNKFMKLLGGGKAGISASQGSQNSVEIRSKSDVRRVQDDLQKQYEAGMRMKFENGGQRKGLGA